MKKKIIRAVTVDCSLGFIEPFIPSLKEKYEIQILSSSGSKLDELSIKYDIKAHRVNMFRRISPFKDIISIFQLIRVFRNEKPYIVHSMTPKAGLLCMFSAFLTGVPVRIHTFTGLVWPTSSGMLRRVLMFTDWLTCKFATYVIPEGKGVLDDLQKYITRKEMRVLGYGNVRGIDMKKCSRRPQVMSLAKDILQKDLFTFIFVGRIVGDKGANELVQAFCRLRDIHPNTRLFLIGDYEDELDPLLPDVMNEINYNPGIIFLGAKYGDNLLAYYAASDCLVFPSYREGFPNVVLEAGAMGLPSIVTDINGSREIIIDGKNGLIVPPKESDSLFQAMERLMLDKELTQYMASNARQMIESRFEQSFVYKCLYDFYCEMTG